MSSRCSESLCVFCPQPGHTSPPVTSRNGFTDSILTSTKLFTPCLVTMPSLFTEPLVVTSRALVVCNFYRYGERCVLTGGSPVSLSVLSLLLLFLWPDTGYTALFCGPAVKSAVNGVPCKPPPPPPTLLIWESLPGDPVQRQKGQICDVTGEDPSENTVHL